jgi:hypothetical protein
MASELKIAPYQDGIEIVGNREGLRELAEICLALSDLSDDEAKTAANHYHFEDFMNTAQAGGVDVAEPIRR